MGRVNAALLLLALLAVPIRVPAACLVHLNEHVVLYGTSDDPDVLLWDSRFRLRLYEGGTFDQMQALLPHAILVRPGTRAMVQSCVPNFVQSKFAQTPDDAVGIVVTQGPLRGKRGWVIGSAIRVMQAMRGRRYR